MPISNQRNATLPATEATASSPGIVFDQIPTSLGLSQNVITSSLQDHVGFLWFGTKDGLNRFDGYSFRVFRHDPNDSSSLSEGNINALLEDHNGRIWVATENGLNLLDPKHESFISITSNPKNQNSLSHNRVNAIAEDAQGAIWIATAGGLDQMVFAGSTDNPLANARFTHFQHDPSNPNSLDESNTSDVLIDSSGVVWVRTAKGHLFNLILTPGTSSYLIKPFLDDGPESSHIFLDSCIGQNGKIWLATSNGLLEWDTNSHQSTFHPHNGAGSPTTVNSILEDQSGYVWYGGYWGLLRFDPNTDRFDFFPSGPRAKDSKTPFLEYGVNSIMEDKWGALWFGSNGKGLFRYDRQTARFAHASAKTFKLSVWHGLSVRSLIELDDGTVLISTLADRFLRLDRSSGKELPTQLPLSAGSLAYSMLQDETGALWIGGLRPFQKIELRNGGLGRVTNYDLEPDKETYPNSNVVDKIFEDRQHNIWVLNAYKLFHYDRATDSFTGYLFNTNTKTPYDNYADICDDSTGRLWIGTTNGLLSFDPQTRAFRRFVNDAQSSASLSHNVVRSVVQDPGDPNVLWLGTAGGGLNRFDTRTETFSVFTQQDGLPNNVVYGILSDDEGYLWMSTNNGISRFHPRTRVFKNFTQDDGLQDNEFNGCAYFKSKSGELYFGGISGFNAFYPSQVKDNRNLPPVVLTDFAILNKPVSFRTKDSPLKQTITETTEITLQYEQRFFSFEFAALDFTLPGRNEYGYQLEGFDKQMIQAGTRRTASYTNVPAGSYVFRVIASNNDGFWNNSGAVIRVTILPPFWQTRWFITLSTLLAISLVFLIYQRRLLQFRREQALQERFSRQLIEEQENERKRIAAELHDGLGQSLLIIKNRAFLGANATEKESAADDNLASAREQFGEISDSAAEALDQVREIASYLRPSQLERLGLTSAIEEMLDRVADSSGIVFDAQLSSVDGVFLPEHEINFYRIIQESVNNIIKHSGATSASVLIKSDEHAVELVIRDNGKGFVYPDGEPAGRENPGFGLKGMAERARIIGGRYQVKSVPDQGTTIFVQIENRK